MNHRILALRLIPQLGSKTVRVVVDPIPESLDLNNNLKLSSSKCNDWRDLFSTDIKDNGRVTITLNGNYPTDCGEKTLYLSLHDSPLYTFSLFKQLWMQQGGVLRGKVRSDSVSERTAPLETHHSPHWLKSFETLTSSATMSPRGSYTSPWGWRMVRDRPLLANPTLPSGSGLLQDNCIFRNWSSKMALGCRAMSASAQVTWASFCSPPSRAQSCRSSSRRYRLQLWMAP